MTIWLGVVFDRARVVALNILSETASTGRFKQDAHAEACKREPVVPGRVQHPTRDYSVVKELVWASIYQSITRLSRCPKIFFVQLAREAVGRPELPDFSDADCAAWMYLITYLLAAVKKNLDSFC